MGGLGLGGVAGGAVGRGCASGVSLFMGGGAAQVMREPEARREGLCWEDLGRAEGCQWSLSK
jgi:hypothetical protein